MTPGPQVVLAQHLHVPAQGNPIESVFGFTEAQKPGGGGGVVEGGVGFFRSVRRFWSCSKCASTILLYAGAVVPQRNPIPFRQATIGGAEPDGKLLDLHVAIFGGEEMAQFVEEDDESQTERQQRIILASMKK